MENYHILELCGEGNFGRVHKARRKGTGRLVALKMIPNLGKSPKELKALEQEITILSQLRHPNIIEMHTWFAAERELVVETELAEGELFEVLEDDGSLPEPEVRAIACQLVSALQYLHARNIVHRDMKPQNILIGANRRVKIADFGFARRATESMVMTSIKGTPLYMAPEVVQEKPYNHTADLWSLGVILFELFVGRPPFYTDNIYTLLRHIVKDPVSYPDVIQPQFQHFLNGLLQKEPAKRSGWPALSHHPFLTEGVEPPSSAPPTQPKTVTGNKQNPKSDLVARRPKTTGSVPQPPSEHTLPPANAVCRPASAQLPQQAATSEEELLLVQQQLVALLNGHIAPQVMQQLPDRLRQLTATLEINHYEHKVDPQMCAILLRAATVTLQRALTVQALDAAAAYVRGGCDALQILEYCADWIVQACSGSSVLARTSAAKLVAVLINQVDSLTDRLTQLVLSQHAAMLRALVLTTCTEADPKLPNRDVEDLCTQALLKLTDLGHLQHEPFPHEPRTAETRVGSQQPHTVVSAAAAIATESSQHICGLVHLLSHQRVQQSVVLQLAAHWTAVAAELSGMLSCAEPALRMLLSVTGDVKGELMAVLGQLNVPSVPRSFLSQLCTYALDSFAEESWPTGLCELLTSLLLHEPTNKRVVSMLQQPANLEQLCRVMQAQVSPVVAAAQVGVFIRGQNDTQPQACGWIYRCGAKDGVISLALAVLPSLGTAQAELLLAAGWQLLLSSANSALSPSGQLTLASLIYDAACICQTQAVAYLSQPINVHALGALLQREPLERLLSWPIAGGSNAVAALVRLVVSTLYLPFIDPATELTSFSRSIEQASLVRTLVNPFDLLPASGLAPPLGLLLRILLIAECDHMAQFIQAGALGHSVVAVLVAHTLRPEQHSGAVESASGDLLSIVSHLARAGGRGHYPAILNSGILQQLAPLIRATLPEIRAKMCNLVGNLCRHDSSFYHLLQAHPTLLSELILRLRDFDSTVRKFASFAVGNAAFHNDLLYGQLHPAVPSLVSLTSDADPRTRANAAGALGNLSRNCAQLLELLMSTGATAALLKLISCDHEKHPRKIALFALGSLCQYSECHETVVANGLHEAVSTFLAEFPQDESIQKVAAKIEHRLQQTANDQLHSQC